MSSLDQLVMTGGPVASTVGILGIAFAFRFAYKTWWKDKIDINAAGGVDTTVGILRAEVERLDKKCKELIQSNDQLFSDKEKLKSQLFTSNHKLLVFKTILVEVLGNEKLNVKLNMHGLDSEPAPKFDPSAMPTRPGDLN